MKKVDFTLPEVDPKLIEANKARLEQAIKWLDNRWVCHPKQHVQRKLN